MEMKNRIHINAVKREIDNLFSELIPKEQTTGNDTILSTQKIKRKTFVRRVIDARNKEALQSIAENRSQKFIDANPDNTYKLFFEIEIERAIDRKTYFPNFKTDSKEKEYYFKLERWVECLTELQTRQIEEAKNERINQLAVTLENLRVVELINKTPADKIKAELELRLRKHIRENGTVKTFIDRYKNLFGLKLNEYQKDSFNLFFEGLLIPPAANIESAIDVISDMSKKTKAETDFTANEIKVLNAIVVEAYNEFINLYEDECEADKFRLAICNNDEEKYEFFDRELKQIKAELEKVRNPVAGWLEIILSKYPNVDFDIKFEQTIQNIIMGDYWDQVEILLSNKTKTNSYIDYLDKFYTSSGDKYYSQPILGNVIKYAAILRRKEYLQGLKNEKIINDEKMQPPAANKKFKVNQIALIHAYEGKQITRENAGAIASQYGYIKKNSGEGLFQDFAKYYSTANRKGKPNPCTPTTLKNKIRLFESVFNHLSDKAKQSAIDEIKILQTIYESEYQ